MRRPATVLLATRRSCLGCPGAPSIGRSLDRRSASIRGGHVESVLGKIEGGLRRLRQLRRPLTPQPRWRRDARPG
eukprot:2522339-Pyramimonas_sp.AAC.1